MKNSKYKVRTIRNAYLLILPLLTGMLVFYAAPFIQVLRNSFFSGIGPAEHFAALENYGFLLSNGVFQLAFGNTMKFLLISIPLILVISFAIALLLKRQEENHPFLKSVLMMPYIMPVAGTIQLVDLLLAQDGLINQGLSLLGLPITDWLQSEYAFPAAVALYLWKNTGYSVILLLSGLNTIPKEDYAAAELDGAAPWQKLLYITLPRMWYSIFFTAVFSLINAFKCFREIFLLGGTHPHTSIYMLQHFINNAFDKLQYPKLAVASVLLLLVLVTCFSAGYHWVMKKEEDQL